MKSLFLTDKQVAAVLGVSRATIFRMLSGENLLPNGVKLSEAEPVYVGKSRRWNSARLAKVLGVSNAEIVETVMGG